tara:strand:+ start:665 stop:1948 length:1284 start_codon:yes stop_codon:yes gene_type:complete
MKKIAIIGAGVMGLSAAYHLLKKDYDVDIYEAAKEPGGMAAHFDFDGLSIERFYHFICKTDFDTFELLDELNIKDELIWKETSMGYFMNEKINKWGDPISLLKFPKISMTIKLRYGLLAFLSTKIKKWDSLENLSAEKWLKKWVGAKGYDILWKKLMELKFHEYSGDISAKWLWTRIRRTGASRKSIFQEELGYINGGSETLVYALVNQIESMGGNIYYSAPPKKIISKSGKVSGLEVSNKKIKYDNIISTIPTPYIESFADCLNSQEKKAYKSIKNIGVVCVLFKLSKKISNHFWLNISDDSIEIPGIIEFSNLRNLENNIIYVPYYMPITNSKFKNSDAEFINESLKYIKKINPQISDNDVLSAYVGRLKHAQPICDLGFEKKLPSIETSVKGLFIADTCFYYPEDRGISESVKMGKKLSELALK